MCPVPFVAVCYLRVELIFRGNDWNFETYKSFFATRNWFGIVFAPSEMFSKRIYSSKNKNAPSYYSNRRQYFRIFSRVINFCFRKCRNLDKIQAGRKIYANDKLIIRCEKIVYDVKGAKFSKLSIPSVNRSTMINGLENVVAWKKKGKEK